MPFCKCEDTVQLVKFFKMFQQITARSLQKPEIGLTVTILVSKSVFQIIKVCLL